MTSDFYSRRSVCRDTLLSFLGGLSDLYLLTGMHGNTGDHLIWAGTRDLLDSARLAYASLPLHEMVGVADRQGTLLVPGSGALVRLWHEWLPDTVLAASRSFRTVVILPSSYDVSVPVVTRCLSQQNVYAFAREPKSYRSTRRFGRSSLSFDCALYFHGFSGDSAFEAPPSDDGALLLALREDEGTLLPAHGVVPNPSLNRDLSLTEATLDDWLAAVAGKDVVVTDRLHIAVASVLLGKRLIYLDPYDRKISTYFAYVFGDEFKSQVSECSVSWLLAHDLVIPAEIG
jgi:exopolysaccharide biosynthesis predicted pyruvyltransferase EpsI